MPAPGYDFISYNLLLIILSNYPNATFSWWRAMKDIFKDMLFFIDELYNDFSSFISRTRSTSSTESRSFFALNYPMSNLKLCFLTVEICS